MPPKHHHTGHRNRLRARFSENPRVLPDHEILELLLFYALPQKDTNEIAHALLERFGSLSGVLYAPVEQLCAVEGLGEISATMFPAMKELYCRMMKETQGRKTGKRAVYDADVIGESLLPHFANLQRERVKIIGLNASFQMVCDAWIGEGTRDRASFVISDILEFIVRNKPHCLILAHNHLSGIGLPSLTDFDATEAVYRALKLVDVPLADHLIFDGQGDFVSLAQSGNLIKEKPNYRVTLRDSKEEVDLTDYASHYCEFWTDFVKKNQTNKIDS